MNLFTLFCFSAMLLFSPFKAEEIHVIKVTINGLKNSEGTVYYSLFNNAEGFPENPLKAFRIGTLKINNKSAQITFSNIPKGDYGFACFHDANENKELDKNMFGYPLESFGTSNNAKGTFGPPSFADAKITVNKNTTLTITVY